MAQKIRKGDIVQIISGRKEDKGKQARVLEVYPKEEKVLVEGINVRTKHLRQVRAKDGTVEGGITRREQPLHWSKVALLDPKTGKPTRVGFKVSKIGERTRVARTKGTATDLPYPERN